MSQHQFDTRLPDGHKVRVVAGWDRPLQEYFLRVTVEGRRQTLFDSLECKAGSLKNLSDLDPYLERLGVRLPEEMRHELNRDGLCNVGEKLVHHFLEDGLYRREQSI